MSAHQITEGFVKRMSRRKFVVRAGQFAMLLTAGAAALQQRVVEAAGCCTPCTDYHYPLRPVGCCNLGYPADCANYSCFSPSYTWWAWYCTDGVTNYSCYECCDFHCSLADSNPTSPARAMHLQTAAR